MDSRYELKLASGKVVTWTGRDAEDAARRYVDAHRDQAIIATRPADRHGLFPLGSPRRSSGSSSPEVSGLCSPCG